MFAQSDLLQDVETKSRELKQKYMRMLITKREAAQELGNSIASIDRMRKNGLIASKSIGGKVMFTTDELARVIVEG